MVPTSGPYDSRRRNFLHCKYDRDNLNQHLMVWPSYNPEIPNCKIDEFRRNDAKCSKFGTLGTL